MPEITQTVTKTYRYEPRELEDKIGIPENEVIANISTVGGGTTVKTQVVNPAPRESD